MDGQATVDNETSKPRVNNRRHGVLDAAAYRFRRQGFAATTMRDIAADAGMLAGSLYYHFKSKTALLIAVHEEGVRRIADAVDAAVAAADPADPWQRLENALAAHLASLLDGGDYAQVVIRDLPADKPELRATLIELRDDYEQRFRVLVDALPLSRPADAGWVRLMLLGAANWSKTWYRPDGAGPAEIAANFVRIIKHGETSGTTS
ncbi:MAG: TetR family transcriptional regulator [Rhodospirillales bacterium]|nr:TetR family transcriptional regulator [Rhodospirillales bacterium]MBO6786111.1 TetR family transcriptional regulator [Rhodospirillales bacterium]